MDSFLSSEAANQQSVHSAIEPAGAGTCHSSETAKQQSGRRLISQLANQSYQKDMADAMRDQVVRTWSEET